MVSILNLLLLGGRTKYLSFKWRLKWWVMIIYFTKILGQLRSETDVIKD